MVYGYPMENNIETIRESLQIFVRRFGLLNASCCEACCGEEISMVQSHILFEVRRLKNPAMQQVAESLGVDVTTFSRQVQKLQTKGLVTREVSSEDRRVNLLGVTEAGMQVLAKIDRYMLDRIGQIFSFLTPFEQEAVSRSLSLLNEALIRAAATNTVACCK